MTVSDPQAAQLSNGWLRRGLVEVLARIAAQAPVGEVLEALLRIIEAQAPGMYAAVILRDPQTASLRVVAAPSLPAPLRRCIGGTGMTPAEVCCIETALTGRRVLIADLAAHEDSCEHRRVAMECDMRACWAEPIVSAAGAVLGAFTIYSRTAHAPDEADLTLLGDCAEIAKVALEQADLAQQLRREHDLVESLFETAHGIVLLLEPGGTIVRYNQLAESLLGRPLAEVIGRNWFDEAVAPQDRERSRREFEAALRGESPSRPVNAVVRFDDQRRIIEWFHSLLRDETGAVSALLAIGYDITARRLTEDALRLRDRSLAATHNGVIIADARAPACPIIYTNAAVTTITGWTQEQVIGRSCEVLLRPRDDDRSGATIQQALSRRLPLRLAFETRRADGAVLWLDLQVTPVRDDAGAVSHFIAVLNDVSAREQTMLELHTRNLELEALADLGQAFISGGTPAALRPRIVALAHEFLGADRVLLLEPDDNGALAATAGQGWPAGVVGALRFMPGPGSLLSRTLRARHPVTIRDLRTAEDVAPSELPGLTELRSAVAICVAGRGSPHGVLAVFSATDRGFGAEELAFLQSLANMLALGIERQRDDNRMRRLQRDLMHAAGRSALADFGTTVAHELNQPVSSVMNYVQAALRLLESSAIPAQARAHLDRAVDEAERAGEIMRRLRRLVDTGLPEVVRADIDEIVRDGAGVALLEADDCGIDVRYHLAADLPPVLVDPVQIQQVVFNLVRNAVEALRRRPDPLLRLVTGRRSAELVEVRVEDNGPGLPGGIFDDADRRLGAEHRTGSGMGIGLSICRSILATHGGRLWTTPAPGGGAALHFTVPVAPRS